METITNMKTELLQKLEEFAQLVMNTDNEIKLFSLSLTFHAHERAEADPQGNIIGVGDIKHRHRVGFSSDVSDDLWSHIAEKHNKCMADIFESQLTSKLKECGYADAIARFIAKAKRMQLESEAEGIFMEAVKRAKGGDNEA